MTPLYIWKLGNNIWELGDAWLSYSICLSWLYMDRCLPTFWWFFLQLNRLLYYKARLHHSLGGSGSITLTFSPVNKPVSTPSLRKRAAQEDGHKSGCRRVARNLSHNRSCAQHCRCECLWLKNRDQLSLHGGQRGRKSKENRGALAKISISW